VFSLCGSSYDTRLAIYSGANCPTTAGSAIATSDDDCGATLQSTVTVNTTAGHAYLIRIGGYNGDVGTGTLTITPSIAPANDLVCNAIAVGEGNRNFSTISACTDGPIGGIHCTPTNDIWFTTQIPQCGTIHIDLCNSNFDTEIQVFHSNDCNNLGSPIACNDDTSACSNSLHSMVEFETPDQGPYYIRVGGYNGATGTGTLNVQFFYTLYINDACSGAYGVDYGTAQYSNHCAYTDGDPTQCGQIYNDLWFTLSPQLNATTTISLCGSSFDTRLAVYYTALSGCGSLSELTCNDDFCGTSSQVSFFRNSLPFGVWMIRVGGAAPGTGGPFTMTITHN
jgi:hypothetical protein